MYTIHYCEAGRQNPDGDRIFRPNGSGDWLFLLFLSPMTVVLPSGTQTAQSGACILYPPDACQDYFAPGVFLNSYIHFSTPEPLIYALPVCTLFYPSDPQHINHVLAQIQAECLTKDMWFDEMSDALLRGLFLSLSREQTTAKTPVSRCLSRSGRHVSLSSPAVRSRGTLHRCARLSIFQKVSSTHTTAPSSAYPPKRT